MHFSSPGQTRRRLTERRTLGHRLTEKRILQPASWTKHPLHDLKLSKLRFTRQVLKIPFLSLHLCLLRGIVSPCLAPNERLSCLRLATISWVQYNSIKVGDQPSSYGPVAYGL